MVSKTTSTKFIAPRPVLSKAEGTPMGENPKSEYRKRPRGPKQTTILETESEKSKLETSWFGILCFLINGICFEFRISSFEL
jgi:hypothetical protein